MGKHLYSAYSFFDRTLQKSHHSRHILAMGRVGLWCGASADVIGSMGRCAGLYDTALFRLFRILWHGAWPRVVLQYKITANFNSPYKAQSIIDFWRRWHMTLSAFLRDYLYIPLGGNRKGKAQRYINLMATMLLGGLWHGAGWTFIIWGGLHGFYCRFVKHLLQRA